MMVVMWDMIKRKDLRMIIRGPGWGTDTIYCHEESSRATDGNRVLK